MAKKRYGIMGGTFDPIHYGHLFVANEALWQFGMDKIIFIPTGRPPHKDSAHITDSNHRYEMTKLAIMNNNMFEVSDREVKKAEKSYTVCTMKELSDIYPDVEFYFITGTDAVLDLPKWRNPEKLFRLCRFIAVNRPGYSMKEMTEKVQQITEVYKGKIEIMKSPQLQISSTDIRERIADGRSIKYLLPESVEKYIADNKLYQNNKE